MQDRAKQLISLATRKPLPSTPPCAMRQRARAAGRKLLAAMAFKRPVSGSAARSAVLHLTVREKPAHKDHLKKDVADCLLDVVDLARSPVGQRYDPETGVLEL